MALVHLQYIDRDVRSILGQWHGVQMVRIAALEPGQAFFVPPTSDPAAEMAALMAELGVTS